MGTDTDRCTELLDNLADRCTQYRKSELFSLLEHILSVADKRMDAGPGAAIDYLKKLAAELPTSSSTYCNHEWVNQGFNQITLACRFCGKER